MDARVDELERLAVLHRQGSLTDEEFAAQKASVLGAGAARAQYATTAASQRSATTFTPAWRRRFSFFEANGQPFSRHAGEAYRKLGFWERAGVLFNPWAFLFGILYFVFLGIPKRGVGLFAIGLICSLILYQLTGSFTSRFAALVMQAVFAMTANWYYFIKVTQGRDEWNPFTDFSASR